MAVKSREDLFASMNTIIGDRNDDQALEFIQDMSDTFDNMQSNSGEYTKEKFDALDASWRQRYRERFFSGSNEKDEEFIKPNQQKEQEEKREETIQINDLFSAKQ